MEFSGKLMWRAWKVSGGGRQPAIPSLGNVGTAEQHKDELNAVSVAVWGSVSLAPWNSAQRS